MTDDVANSESAQKAFGPEKWRRLYSQADGFLEEAAVTLAPFGGLTANALAHLRSDWIEWGDEFVIIQIPAEAECNRWKLSGESENPLLVQRDRTCKYCRTKGSTDRFENLWGGRGSSGGHRYKATLHRDIAEPAVTVLDRVFNNWGRSELSALPSSVTKAAKRLISDNNTNFHYSKLLRTGVVLYCYYGISREDIVDLTPFTKSSVKDIERATPEVGRNRNNAYIYLRALANEEPTSVQELAQGFEVHDHTVWGALKNLKERGRVEVNKDGKTHIWSTVGDWSDPFVCGECGFKSATLNGINKHEASHD